MIAETAVIFTLSALAIIMLVFLTYALIVWFFLFILAWGFSKIFRPLFNDIS